MALTKDSFIKMNDGHRIPVLGFGTYAPEKVPKSRAKQGTKVAIDAGFRHIDSAFLYQNEVEVGEAIREKIADGTVKREEIFYTSKLWSTCHSPELVRPALMKSLKALQLDYIDLYLIHWPKSLKPGEDMYPADENGKLLYHDVDLCATWEVLEACRDEGLVRSIGVSNFTESQLEMILNKSGLKHKPVCNQVECHVYLNQKKMLEFCKTKDIVLVAYSVLGSSREENWVDQKSPVLLDDPVLINIGQKYKKSSAQVAMRYLLQQGIVVLAKSFTPERIKQNLQVPKSQAKEAVKVAIDAGFRHIDAAFIYQNEVEVGEAIREKIADGTVKREEIFYTSKLWSTFHSPELVRPALMKSLKALQLDYIDLYLIHIPVSMQPGEDLIPLDENGKWRCIDVDLRDTWEALEACKDEGLVRSIGVSNFTEKELELILDKPGLKHKPVCNQVECHLYLNQKNLFEFCKSKDMVLVAHSVLGSSRHEKWIDQNSPVLLNDPVLLEIGQKYKKSCAQVAIRCLLQQGIVVLAKSFTPERIKQNLQVFDFHLTPEDMNILEGLNKNMNFSNWRQLSG